MFQKLRLEAHSLISSMSHTVISVMVQSPLIAQIEKVSLPTSGNTRRPKGKPVIVNTSMALRSIKIRKRIGA